MMRTELFCLNRLLLIHSSSLFTVVRYATWHERDGDETVHLTNFVNISDRLVVLGIKKTILDGWRDHGTLRVDICIRSLSWKANEERFCSCTTGWVFWLRLRWDRVHDNFCVAGSQIKKPNLFCLVFLTLRSASELRTGQSAVFQQEADDHEDNVEKEHHDCHPDIQFPIKDGDGKDNKHQHSCLIIDRSRYNEDEKESGNKPSGLVFTNCN